MLTFPNCNFKLKLVYDRIGGENMNIAADFDNIENLGVKVLNYANDYRDSIKVIYSEIDALASAWQGADNLAYVTKANEYKPDMDKMGDVIQSYGDYLKGVARDYRQMQQDIIDSAKTI